jgi:hypothetical protein
MMVMVIVVIPGVRGQNPGETSQPIIIRLSLRARAMDTLGRNINFERSNRVEPGDRGLAATSKIQRLDASCIK